MKTIPKPYRVICDKVNKMGLTKIRELEHLLNNNGKHKFKLVIQFQLDCQVFVVVLVAGAALNTTTHCYIIALDVYSRK